MLSREGKQTDRGAVGAEFIGYNRRRREALLLQEFPHQPNCRPSVPAGLNQEIQDFALTVHGTPEIELPPSNYDDHLVQVPAFGRSWPPTLNPPRIGPTEFQDPSSNCLIRDVETTLGKQVLNVPIAQRETAIEPDGMLDDDRWKAVTTVGYLAHPETLERVRHRQNQKGDSQGSQKVIQAMSWVKGGQPWMTRPYSEDLRERVVRVVESGTSRNAAAKQFDVSISFVVKLMQRWKQRGTIKADKYGGWKKSKLAPHGDRIRALVMENCDITIDELCVLLAAEGIEAKRSTLGDFLLAQGLSRKKRQPTPPSRSALTSRRREPLGATSNLG